MATVIVPIGFPPESVRAVGAPSVNGSDVPSPFVSIIAAVTVLTVSGSPSLSVSLARTFCVVGVSSVTEIVSSTPTGGRLLSNVRTVLVINTWSLLPVEISTSTEVSPTLTNPDRSKVSISSPYAGAPLPTPGVLLTEFQMPVPPTSALLTRIVSAVEVAASPS